MTSDDELPDGEESAGYLAGIDEDELIDDGRLAPSPEQHERLKSGLHGDRFADFRRADRRYLVVGRGGDGGPGRRRERVANQLDDRVRAVAVRLEDFGFTEDELELWVPAFDVLSSMASHIVGVLEDFDGGHVWELGYLYYRQTHVRDILWLLKRIYDSRSEMREHYDNGMAASHLVALENAANDRVITWEEPPDLPAAVERIP